MLLPAIVAKLEREETKAYLIFNKVRKAGEDRRLEKNRKEM
jgi:hypothetical protein